MTQKILLKITWEDIRSHFRKAVREGVMINTNEQRIIIPTTSEIAFFSELKECVEDWFAMNAKITIIEGGFIGYEIVWSDNYQIEVKV